GEVHVQNNRLNQINALRNLNNLYYVDVRNNVLDLSSMSPAWAVITNLQGRNVSVDYDPQNAAPIILTQPQSRIVSPGANVSFTVSAVPTHGMLYYQWQFANQDIAGATDNTLS